MLRGKPKEQTSTLIHKFFCFCLTGEATGPVSYVSLIPRHKGLKNASKLIWESGWGCCMEQGVVIQLFNWNLLRGKKSRLPASSHPPPPLKCMVLGYLLYLLIPSYRFSIFKQAKYALGYVSLPLHPLLPPWYWGRLDESWVFSLYRYFF